MCDSKKKERVLISLPQEVYADLKDYVYFEDCRTVNSAAAEIVADFLLEWKEKRS